MNKSDEASLETSLPKAGINTPASLTAFLQSRAATWTVLIYQIIVLICFAAIPVFALNWLRLPFIGTFIDHTLAFNVVGQVQSNVLDQNKVSLLFGYQLTALNNEPIHSTNQLYEALTHFQPGDTVKLTIKPSIGPSTTQEITLGTYPLTGQVTLFYIPYLVGLICLFSSLWVFSQRHGDAAGRAFALFTASTALLAAGVFDLFTTHHLTYLWTFSLALTGGAIINLAVLFPEEIRLVSHYPLLRWSGYVPAFVLAAISLPTLYNLEQPAAHVTAWRAELIFSGIAAIAFIGWTIIQRASSRSPIVREQARLILWGAGLSIAPIASWFFFASIGSSLSFSPYLLLPAGIFPAVTAYAILRYRLLNTDYIFSRVVSYTLLSVLAVAGYALFVSGLSLIFGNIISANNPILIGLMVFILAILLNPLRLTLQKQVDAVFFRGQSVIRQRIEAFTRELTQAMDIPSVLERLYETVDQVFYPSLFHIFVYDTLTDQYAAAPIKDGITSSDLRFPMSSALVHTLSKRRSSIFIGASETLPLPLQMERARLALLGAQLFIPLPGQQQLVGWLALGPKRSGEPYNQRDLGYLESLSDQAALAIERAQVIANLERRVHEMDVLTRVAQGINITLAFDDILELIYAQTNQVVPNRDFRIVLYEKSIDRIYYAFFLEDDERLNHKENLAITANQGLEVEVIRSRRSLVTDDYARECRGRGVMPEANGVFAWMGVPLNAGAEVIGAISLASREAAIVYTEQQLNLLQAIADQAAGAIVKARLLQETESHAKQLASLNDIGRSLTSTLELQPLLNQILLNASDILNCEAGSLFLLDTQTDEMVFEVTAGPVADDLVGKRLPPGTGLVGEAVRTQKPVISNDVRRTKGWYESTDKQTGFVTRDLLVVPMQVKERVIGVIEVINKKDGTPFDSEDQELLSTFASQAAIAIENARLYTQTDEALSARVEEMSVMQRIDRELNASLDLERAMNITLDWCMRQSKADAGMLGLIDEGDSGQPERLRVMVSQGYTKELDKFSKTTLESNNENEGLHYLPVDFPALQEALENSRPQSHHFPQMNEEPNSSNPIEEVDPLIESSLGTTSKGLLSGAKSQAVIPIRREEKVIGIILLESCTIEVYPQEIVTFLSRLSDHAAIAIANGQLYADLQAANLAKSDFVSLVSHELKTPMTSIKGYADLLAQGAVGPITDIQANFLSTIRTNVNRMATLVSDLADVSRIEAGRLHLEFSAVPLSEAVDEVIRSAKAQMEEKQQTLQLQIPADLPAVWGDRTRIIQVLTNLISNAHKYSPASGQIIISAERSSNQWDPNGAPEVVHIAVQDSGFGISPEDQKKIFQKFFRSEDPNIRDAPGTGLGLNITRYLVEMQGGCIWFESELGTGTTFHFTIPITAMA
jgi:signal transduction histidine kinase